ncbi:MAG: hypothetical protein RLZZ122_713 [Actinomycetota bacterium]
MCKSDNGVIRNPPKSGPRNPLMCKCCANRQEERFKIATDSPKFLSGTSGMGCSNPPFSAGFCVMSALRQISIVSADGGVDCFGEFFGVLATDY